MAGRGFGKTRAGAEWVNRIAAREKGIRIALVGATAAEVRNVMVEGESGILAACGAPRPRWEPTRGMLSWPGGSRAFVYSGENPEGLRGPQHHAARSAKRRVGKACVSPCRSRWSPSYSKKKK